MDPQFFVNIHKISVKLIEQGSETTKSLQLNQPSEYVLKKKQNSTTFKSGDDQADVI